MTTIADGKALSEKIYEEIKNEVSKLQKKPTLAVIITNDNEAGKVYVRNKQRACEKTGINSTTINFEANVTEHEILEKIEDLNNDNDVDAILV